MKKCPRCGEIKSFSGFSKCKKTVDGYFYYCKECDNKRAAEYRIRSAEKLKEKRQSVYWDNPEKFRKRSREFRMNNPEKMLEYQRKYSSKNRNKINKRFSIYYKNVLSKDINYKLSHNMSWLIWSSLKRNKNGEKWESLVDYSLEDLKKHLESQFTDGMTWDNYGEWHVDHIIPKSLFNINSVKSKGFKKCWELNNLQPLWAKDNLSKRDKLFHEYKV